MKNKIQLAIIALSVIVSSCATPSANGVSRPSISTNPRTYLRNFPLNKASESEILDYVGAPTRTHSTGDTKYLTYNIATKHNSGVLEYTYKIKNDRVYDVSYNNSGNFFGAVQRESATNLQGR